MNSTDYLRINELKIFKNVRNCLPKCLSKSMNLLTVKDGVVFTWDFENNCALTLNLKAARTREGDNVSHQSLLSLVPIVFQPELLVVNECCTLLVVAGSSGILVMELPSRCPPYGSFGSNKDIAYCRSHNLDQRLFLCNDVNKLRQIRFHPGSPKNNHILALTSDNILRLYAIENGSALSVATFPIGETPRGVFPGTKISYLSALGEVGVDFDFGQPQLNIETKSLFVQEKNKGELVWPVYVLKGDGEVYSINIPLGEKTKKCVITGPLKTNIYTENVQEEACAIICMNTTPEIICIANSKGTIYHSVVLPLEKQDYEALKENSPNASKNELLCFESIDLELGLSTTDDDNNYTCPIFLHKDESKPGRFYASHSAGIHSVNILCLRDLQSYINGADQLLNDIFNQESKAEYLVCTKVTKSKTLNPIVGFALYYEPTSLIAFLSDGNVLSLGILTTELLPKIEEVVESKTEISSPLKKIMKEPFDQTIQQILKRSLTQPILKLGEAQSQKECYELLQRASQIFREHFENHARAKEEIEKRIKAIQMMKDFQLQQLNRMNSEKNVLREKAENLAERYEDLKDKHDLVAKRCEKLLLLVSQNKAELSDAEKEYLNQLEKYMEKVELYKTSVNKLKMKVKYQKIQMANWKAQEEKKVTVLGERHSDTIKESLKEMSETIQDMVKQINEFKEKLHLK